MKKKSYTNSDEIDLRQLFKTIWKEKIKIILIMLVIIVINFGHNQYKISNRIDLFEISLKGTDELFSRSSIFFKKSFSSQE